MNKYALAIILLGFLIGVFAYPQLPEIVASHWDSQGQVNGYLPRFWGAFLVPAVNLGLYALFSALIRIDPLKKNIISFRRYYEGFITFMLGFMLYIYILTLLWAFGIRYNMIQMTLPAMGLLFIYIGYLLPHTKRNWFMGIRTPWTLSSDAVWEKTHERGGLLFKGSGALALLGMFFPEQAVWLILVPVLASSLYLVIYSYLVFRG